ncbi:hypothetical protein [Corallococcus macrosporus]|uniref:PDZ domain-containing protein n=2 Tax=Myxococcaceae TaxID=31 RepID=A0A250JN87_9BACT|nr:hypothetical protein [Corallococcus macrosporus]AEI62985.1 hypothetical protein LILAB_05320 [Corallococcus macrosporus]ATB45123.1 hypothetical protein MYMAC_000707 [Corallococcus macrosporus DSM 14697]
MKSPILILGLLVASAGPSHAAKSSHERVASVNSASSSTSTDRVSMQANGASLVVELKPVSGASVVLVTESAPAAFWPFQKNDIIIRINAKQIARPSDILFVWRTGAPSSFEFEVVRGGNRVVFTGTAADFPGLALPPTPEPPPPPPAP